MAQLHRATYATGDITQITYDKDPEKKNTLETTTEPKSPIFLQ